MITVRPYEAEQDYSEIAEWWRTQGWPVLPVSSLPFGFIAQDETFTETTKLAAAFLYSTEATLHIMEWIVGNPLPSWELRGKGIDAVVLACCKRAEELGGQAVITTTRHERLIERYKEMGFQVGDEGMTHLVLSLNKKEK